MLHLLTAASSSAWFRPALASARCEGALSTHCPRAARMSLANGSPSTDPSLVARAEAAAAAQMEAARAAATDRLVSLKREGAAAKAAREEARAFLAEARAEVGVMAEAEAEAAAAAAAEAEEAEAEVAAAAAAEAEAAAAAARARVRQRTAPRLRPTHRRTPPAQPMREAVRRCSPSRRSHSRSFDAAGTRPSPPCGGSA